jgi:hypothetical protein
MAKCPRRATELLAGICLGCGWRATATEADSTPIEVQAPEPPPVYTPLKKRAAVPLPLLLGAGGVVAIAVVALALSGGNVLEPPGAAGAPSRDKAAIRAWLKENLPTGEWEEIRWEITPLPNKSETCYRLKLRTAGPFGETVHTRQFNVDGGQFLYSYDVTGVTMRGDP